MGDVGAMPPTTMLNLETDCNPKNLGQFTPLNF